MENTSCNYLNKHKIYFLLSKIAATILSEVWFSLVWFGLVWFGLLYLMADQPSRAI